MTNSPIHAEDRFLKVPGGRVFTRNWSPSRSSTLVPVILLHDSVGCVELWRDFPAVLAHTLGQTIIAYDRLGFGRSSARTDEPSPDFIREEADVYFPAIRHALGIEKFALFGYSVSGGMASATASRMQ